LIPSIGFQGGPGGVLLGRVFGLSAGFKQIFIWNLSVQGGLNQGV
jgi:hypothetical protein